MRGVHIFLICAVSGLLAGLLPNGASADTLLGYWVLNQELSRELQPANTNQKKSLFGRSNGSPSIVLGGIPIPIPGRSGSTQEVSSGPTTDPRVLRCEKMTIELVGDDILFTYAGFGIEQLKQGNDRGTKTTYKSTKLTSRYTTTSRRVTKTFELTREGRLHVTVRLQPTKGKTLIYHRIFDRAS
ncbi:MAG: hypothetical protein O7G86_01855 [Gammaproteobacteria bacterium]|nr:hypothetical protein [Gammaproteobacteria bacterium]